MTLHQSSILPDCDYYSWETKCNTAGKQKQHNVSHRTEKEAARRSYIAKPIENPPTYLFNSFSTEDAFEHDCSGKKKNSPFHPVCGALVNLLSHAGKKECVQLK